MISGGYSVAVATSVLPNPMNTILFCGYQGLGCSGRNILDSEYGDVINIDNKKVKRKCSIDFMNMSSHADYRYIIDMFKTTRHTKIKNIMLSHGDEDVLVGFKKHINEELNANVFVSDYDKWYKLK